MKSRSLTPKAAALLDESDAVRIKHIRGDRWISYPVADGIIQELEELLIWPETIRPPCRLIVAETNNGKTSLIQRFVAQHPPDENLQGEQVKVDILAVEISTSDEKGMYEVMLRQMFQVLKPRESKEERRQHVVSMLKRIRPRLILLDESNDFIRGSARQMHACLVGLKHISNITKIPIAAAGTPEARRVFAADKQIENRFEVLELPRWKLNGEFRGLLKGIEQTLPLRHASGLANKVIAEYVFHRTRGILGEVCSLLSKAATRAIRTGTERITLKELEECGYRSGRAVT